MKTLCLNMAQINGGNRLGKSLANDILPSCSRDEPDRVTDDPSWNKIHVGLMVRSRLLA